jgi:hypothetical protein
VITVTRPDGGGVTAGVGDAVTGGVADAEAGGGEGDAVTVGPPVRTINCGGLGDSLLARLRAVEWAVVMAKLLRPLLVTSDVTLKSYQVPAVTGPVVPTAAPKAGCVSYVTVDSDQTVSVIECTENPTDWLLLAKSLSVAEVTPPLTPCTSKRTKLFSIGDASTLSWLFVP